MILKAAPRHSPSGMPTPTPPVRPRFPVARKPALTGIGLTAAMLLLSACAGERYDLPPGGLAPSEAAQLSLIAGQTRAQFPSLSEAHLPFALRKPPPEEEAQRPEPALKGEGVSVQPGIQTRDSHTVQALLLLDKTTYARGQLRVRFNGGPEETWRILAYDKRGSPTDDFDFSYLLLDPQGRVRYLVLIGGVFEDGGKRFAGYEGTLVLPGPGGSLSAWERAYKLNFGYRLPIPPVYQEQVDRSERMLSVQNGLLRDLERARDLMRDNERTLEAARASGTAASPAPNPTGASPAAAPAAKRAPTPAELAALQQALAAAQTRVRTLSEQLETQFLEYFRVRTGIESAYAEFVESNRFRWANRAGQREYHQRWQETESQNARIDEQMARFLRLAPGYEKGMNARLEAQAAVRQYNNRQWLREP